MKNFDVMVVGAGVVGATVALALAQNPALKILLLDAQSCESAFHPEKYDHRVSAISHASKRIFQQLNVWEKIKEKRLSSYTHMHVWEKQNKSKIDFDCDQVNESSLGYIVEDNVMRASLYEQIQNTPNIEFIFPVTLSQLYRKPNGIELIGKQDENFFATCLIAADGANSWVRDQVGIELKTVDYDQTAIISTVTTEFSHQKTAWQIFLPEGPLAFLPLNDENKCSIVWSTSPDYSKNLLVLDDANFCDVLSEAFENRLGKVVACSKRLHFPLTMRHAKNYVQANLALIGDAVHTPHPLAGQGVNLGLLDAACLAEVMLEAIKKERDFSSYPTLRKYERWRKSDNVAMLTGVGLIKKLFTSEKKSLQTIRQFGLNSTDRIKPLKNFFINYALGKRRDLPALANIPQADHF